MGELVPGANQKLDLITKQAWYRSCQEKWQSCCCFGNFVCIFSGS